MIDIHTHILPSVDDGPKSSDESLKIIRDIKKDGVKKIIQTTHINELYKDVNKKKIRNLIKDFENEIQIIEGYEVNLSYISNRLDNYTIEGTRYILVEFSIFSTISIILSMIERLKSLNLYPIIAHIERYTENLERIKELKKKDVLLQLNAETFLKDRFFRKLVYNDLIDFIASDIHPKRKYLMREAYEKLKKFNGFLADKMFFLNPEMILKKEE